MTERDPYDRFELQAFIVRLGAAMNAAGDARLQRAEHARPRCRQRTA
jgi:hypothetical protein